MLSFKRSQKCILVVSCADYCLIFELQIKVIEDLMYYPIFLAFWQYRFFVFSRIVSNNCVDLFLLCPSTYIYIKGDIFLTWKGSNLIPWNLPTIQSILAPLSSPEDETCITCADPCASLDSHQFDKNSFIDNCSHFW